VKECKGMAARRKKGKLRGDLLFPVAVYALLVTSLLFLFTSIFLRSYNNTLSTKTQSVEAEVSAVKEQNEEAEREINQLASPSRVAAVAEASLSYQAQNIVTLPNGQ